LPRSVQERSAAVGDLLYQVGDRPHSLMVVLEGAVSITDTSGNELIRHGPSDFVGELNLLTGQTVFVNAVVVGQQVQGVGIQIIGPSTSDATGSSSTFCVPTASLTPGTTHLLQAAALHRLSACPAGASCITQAPAR